MVRTNLLPVKKEKEIRANFVSHLKLQVITTVPAECLVTMEKPLHLWVVDINRKRVPTDIDMLRQKALSLHKTSVRGPLKQPSRLLQVRNPLD